MLAKAVPESEFAQANSVLAKTAPFSFCRLQGLSLPWYFHGVTAGWCALCGTSPRQRYLHPCLLIQLSRYSYSSANHPGGLLPAWAFTLRDCCAIMATIGICAFCCRPLNVSNLCFLFVWRMDIICFQNSYCRIGGAKNE